MPRDRHDIEALVAAALGKTTAEARAAFLSEACGGDADFRGQVEELLKTREAMIGREKISHLRSSIINLQSSSCQENPTPAAGQLGWALADQAQQTSTVHRPSSPPEGRGTRIGPYKLLQPLGEGGMGSVWMAEQTEPVRRMVALKVIKPGMDSSNVLARFEAERQALALMEHQNIARVFDAGTTEAGRPFFVMELVKGIPITKYCDEQRLSIRERLELFLPVCQAIQHAHQKGIIHRDIKPGNVLVAQYDGKAVPKVIDFGVAKAMGEQLTERTLFTEFGAILGTIEYMSPEQARGQNKDLTLASDIWSLGAVLYHLLTGRPPVQGATAWETLKAVVEQEPTRPREMSRQVDRDLETICLKCLEKDPQRRYGSARALAQDVERWLKQEPIMARPVTHRERVEKWYKRNPVMANLTAAVIVVASLGFAGWLVARERGKRADKAKEQAQQILSSSAAFLVKQTEVETNLSRARELLEGLDEAIKRQPTNALFYTAKGVVLARTGRPTEAYEVLSRAIGLANNHADHGLLAEAFLARCTALQGMDRFPEAAMDFRQATDLPAPNVVGGGSGLPDFRFASEVSINLGATNWESGLQHISGGDGVTLPDFVDGKECRLVPFRGDQPLWYAYFLVDPTFKWPDFKWATGRTLKVRVEYHQFGSGRFGIDYDGPEGHYTQSRKSISLTGARQWTSAEFQLAGARFGNAQNQKADFRLWTSGSPLFVRRVSVRKEPGVPELEGLIQKGISLAKSNRLVEACQSLSNAIEFFDRKPLSDKYLLIKAVSIRRDLLQRMGRFNEAGADNCRCRNIPPRDAKAKSELLDLSLYYNAALTEDQIGLPGFDLTSLPVGVRKLGNVEFDLRGVVQLCGKGASQRPRDRYPSAVMGIPLNRNFARLHFLVGTEWSEPDSTKIGCLAINYVDGEKRELPLVYGENVRDWNRSADPREAPGASVVWTSENRGVKQSGGFIGLFLVTWDNPRPEVRATSLDFVSNKTQCKPFLIAITAASSVTPDIPEFWLKKAGDLQKQRKVAAAIETLNRGIERCGQDPILHQIRGMLLAETDRLEEAFRSLSAAIDLADALNTPSTFVPEVRLARCGVLKRMNRIAEAGDDYCRAKGYPTRDRKAKFGLVDLSLYYNAALADDFLGGLPGFDLSSLTSGIRDFAGVEFDVRALIQLTGKAVVQRGWTNYPSAVRDIPLPATKINCFHFLLATEWSESEGTKIGAVVINYADGENQELPLTYGEDLRDWFSAEGTRKVSRATVAWIGQTPHSRKHGGFVRLFLSTRDNPRPGAQAKSMDFVSFNTGCSPFLVATTVE